ncbi:hypothetical protein GCM10010341_80950 [Streptomyces noursei]|nr:hypothetical protein GCM10010341_80950 [Streptomyces noursei]
MNRSTLLKTLLKGAPSGRPWWRGEAAGGTGGAGAGRVCICKLHDIAAMSAGS